MGSEPVTFQLLNGPVYRRLSGAGNGGSKLKHEACLVVLDNCCQRKLVIEFLL